MIEEKIDKYLSESKVKSYAMLAEIFPGDKDLNTFRCRKGKGPEAFINDATDEERISYLVKEFGNEKPKDENDWTDGDVDVKGRRYIGKGRNKGYLMIVNGGIHNPGNYFTGKEMKGMKEEEDWEVYLFAIK